MFCRRCGKYNPDTKERCVYCGGDLSDRQTVYPKQNIEIGENKAWFGVLMALFLGITGLIIGLGVLSGYERKTFTRGWLICIAILVAIVFILAVVARGILVNILQYLYYYLR